MWASRKLILIFYKPIFILNFIFSIICIRFVDINGWVYALNTIFIKLAGYGFTAGYQYFFAQQAFFYFRNSGVSITRMYVYTFGLDFLLFILMLTVYDLAAK